MVDRLDVDGMQGLGRGRMSRLERVERALFEGEQEGLSPIEVRMRDVYESIITHWLSHPETSDSGMVRWVMEQHGRSESAAYRDVGRAKDMMGRVQNAGREFQRYRVIEMLLESYSMARDQGDPGSMVRAAAQLGKYTQLDKPDVEQVDWNRLAPPVFEPSDNVRILGIDPIEDVEAVRKELALKYTGSAETEP